MKFTLAVHGAPHNSQAALSAYRFARAVLRRGHQLQRVFFYHDGVQTASTLAVPPQEETDVGALWVGLHEETGTELDICIAASLKRGMLDETERDRYERNAANVHPAFQIAGLGVLIEAAIECDRLVTFRA
ncbi:MAG: sulfurtransferase complex subunit TusD [Pseudomonadales bacterium]|nr:sulfurtransferase complex subunit TusD [Pseudomonadales bacterium]MDP6473072.1 sulfurtransferase complex subunit TusD [Pseudomonadales bacterium]MDP6826171.1 sulfurtransferase complex subunit TusD [Pseudomonadales bacterium]MDP6971959.1 sulfurtransferase complex subunit TusD [Pseudomonadales bacterium]